MEWNLKAQSSWDLAELEQEAFSGLETVNGSTGREDFSVDLKLGRVGNSVSELAAKTTTTSSGSSKRSRGCYGGAASCLVDGCTADLSGCRDYHRRHKVCELHSKTPQVTIGGHNQRFCQQCSRFHALEEFDEGKRSCRKRLDGHNRRRRKPQPEPFSRYGTLLSNYQGTQLLPFSSSLVYPSTAVVNPSWAGAVVKTEAADSGLQNSMFLSPSSTKPFLVFQGHRQSNPPEICHSLLSPFPLCDATSAGDRTKLVFYDKLAAATTTTTTTTTTMATQECALSLLSSPPPQTSEMGLGHHNNDNDNMSHQLGSFNLEPMGSSVVEPNGSEVHCPGMFHDIRASAANSHQVLPSHWGQV